MPEGIRLVITGGIGSGKSSVSSFLAGRGWQVIDGDGIGHEALKDPEILAEVGRRWPEALAGGEVDRRALGRIVFGDPHQLSRLEGLVHPYISARLSEWVGLPGGPRAMEVSVPGIIDPKWGPIVVVDAPDQLRRERSALKDLGLEEVEARMRAQPDRREWLRMADYVISNTGSREDLAAATARLASALERP
jgi:dephospho-CoA kinase